MGESEYMHQHNVEYVQKLCDIISDIKIQTGLPVMISPGVVHGWALKQIADTGADWYACYQETHNQELFSQLRPGQDYQKRLSVKQTASELNMLIEEGILCGVGETFDDLIEDSRRTVAYVQKKILACGNYQIANHKDYRSWIAHRKQNRFNSCKSDPALKAI